VSDLLESSTLRICLAIALLTLSLGCRHRGAAWSDADSLDSLDSPDSPGIVEIFVIGQPRESPETRAVARRLDRVLHEASDAGRTPIILWLGTDFGPRGPDAAPRCPMPFSALESPALSDLAEVVLSARGRGGSAFGLPGPDGWRCGLSGYDAAFALRPYQQPGLAYVLRVSTAGTVTLASSCDSAGCIVTPADDDTLVELVALDTSSWHYRELAGDDLNSALFAQQASLLAALAQQAWRPRILVSPIPIESAGSHGLGGRRQRTAFHYVPEFVQDALADGLFVGVLGALERDLQVSVDLSGAIIRGERRFIDARVFQVVSGSAGGASHTVVTSRGTSLEPDLESEHTGFAILKISPETSRVQVHVHARVAARWRVAALELALGPAPLEPLRETPTIHPCQTCDPQSGATDGDVFVPRGDRPH
jgi:hypothetical protein